MITRLLRRFCSPEVKMMLKHIEEHPEDFRLPSVTHIYGRTSRWALLANEVELKGTFIEQIVLRNVEKEAFKKADRQRLLGEIVAQTIAPETVSQEEIEDGTAMLNTKNMVLTGLANSQFQNQTLQGQLGVGVGNPTQLAHLQHIAAHQQAMLNQYKNASNQP